MPDTSPAKLRCAELTAQRNAVLDANEQLHLELIAAVDAVFATYAERIACVSGALKRERGGDKIGSNGRHRKP